MTQRNRVVVIGLDGADPELIRSWALEGKLPAFRRLMREGAFGKLRSVPNQRSAAAWTTFMTGKNPGKHGIYEFYEYEPGKRRIRFLNGADRDATTLWTLVGRSGRKVGVVNVPMTYPAEAVNGFLIAGLDAPGRKSKGFTHPPEILAELEGRYGEYVLEPGLTGLIVAGKIDEAVQALWAELDQKARVVEYLMAEKEWDLFVVVFRSLDAVQHCFWKYMDGPDGSPPSGGAKAYGDTIEKAYRRIDRYVGAVMERLDGRTSLVIVSDHGFGRKHTATSQLNRWLEVGGFLQLKRRRLRVSLLGRAHRALVGHTPRRVKEALWRLLPSVRDAVQYELCFSRIDWRRTVAYSDTLYPNIWLNLRREGPFGGVRSGVRFREALCSLKEHLADCSDSLTGERIVEDVLEKREIYHGRHAERAPDLLVRWREDVRINGLAGVAGDGTGQDTYVIGENPDVISGDHRLHGVLFAWGKPIKGGVHVEQATLADVAPTVLYLLDEAVPADFDGAVLRDLFREDFQTRNPVRFAEPSGSGGKLQDGRYTEDEAEVMRERLRGLGYLE